MKSHERVVRGVRTRADIVTDFVCEVMSVLIAGVVVGVTAKATLSWYASAQGLILQYVLLVVSMVCGVALLLLGFLAVMAIWEFVTEWRHSQ